MCSVIIKGDVAIAVLSGILSCKFDYHIIPEFFEPVLYTLNGLAAPEKNPPSDLCRTSVFHLKPFECSVSSPDGACICIHLQLPVLSLVMIHLDIFFLATRA